MHVRLIGVLDVTKFSLVSDQVDYAELNVIVRELEKVLSQNIPGAVVELGCYVGTTSLFIQRLLQTEKKGRAFHVYDSFGGLPPKTDADTSPAGEQFKAGELTASKQQFIKHFKQAGLPLPTIHKCWFEQLTAADMPEQQIAFAFLDGDFFTSIESSLAVITPRLAPGATIIVDDYQSEALPGAKKATDAWAKQHNLPVRTEKSLAIINWPQSS